MKKNITFMLLIMMSISVISCTNKTEEPEINVVSDTTISDTNAQSQPPDITEIKEEITTATTTTTTAGASAKGDIKLSDDDLTKLNTYFSNFIESGLWQYDSKTTDDRLAMFAMQFNYYNNNKLFTYEDGSIETEYYNRSIRASEITATIQRFFARKYTPKTFAWGDSGRMVVYQDGKFYMQMGEGESIITFAQVTKFYNNGDGTYAADIEAYRDNNVTGGDMCPKENYQPKKNWSTAIKNRCEKTGDLKAVVKKGTYNGKHVYVLLSIEIK